jgi:hypothetical protein
MWTNALLRAAVAFAGLSILAIGPDLSSLAFAQDQPAAADDAAAADAAAAADEGREPLDEGELDILVARIALYPDDLVALISTAALYPLQIVDAARFLEQVQTSPDLKPKESWDGSVISLLNYPDIVKMMSDDLDWTQAFGDAIADQQQDVLTAVQRLRDNAVTTGSIKSDDKIQVVHQGSNVVIQPTDPDNVYIPQYDPAMLYEPARPPVPIGYYPRVYPNYYHPVAPYFAGFVTGAAFAAVVDWDHWGVWGGRWDGGDVDIDCNNCFNNKEFNGKVKFNDVDWKNVDRSKINVNKDQLNNIDRTKIRNNIEANDKNSVRSRAADADRAGARRKPGDADKATGGRNTAAEGPGANRGGGQNATAGKAGGRETGARKSGGGETGARKSGGHETGARKSGGGETGAAKRGTKKSTATTHNKRPGKADRQSAKSKSGSGSNAHARQDRDKAKSRKGGKASECPERSRRC